VQFKLGLIEVKYSDEVWSCGGLGGRDGKITRGNNSQSVSLEPKIADWSLFNTSTPDPCRWWPLVASRRIHEILGQPTAAQSNMCMAKVKLGNTWSK